MFPDFISRQSSDATIWIARKYAESNFSASLRDLDALLAAANCQIVKDQRKIKVGRLSTQIDGRPQVLFIKRYNMFSRRHKWLSPLALSGAFRALRGAAILHGADIPIPVPVAAVEHRQHRMLGKSFFITEELSGGKTVDAYWSDELAPLTGQRSFSLKHAFLVQLGQLFRRLHERQIYHNDLKDANILAVADRRVGGVEFFLLDLEGVKRYALLNSSRKLKNLVQIHRTLGRYLRPSEKLLFLKAYLDGSFSDRKLRRRWAENVRLESRRLDIAKAPRRQALTGLSL